MLSNDNAQRIFNRLLGDFGCHFLDHEKLGSADTETLQQLEPLAAQVEALHAEWRAANKAFKARAAALSRAASAILNQL